jgi:hypothetical protein
MTIINLSYISLVQCMWNRSRCNLIFKQHRSVGILYEVLRTFMCKSECLLYFLELELFPLDVNQRKACKDDRVYHVDRFVDASDLA